MLDIKLLWEEYNAETDRLQLKSKYYKSRSIPRVGDWVDFVTLEGKPKAAIATRVTHNMETRIVEVKL